jgi:hypothetical protein
MCYNVEEGEPPHMHQNRSLSIGIVQETDL